MQIAKKKSLIMHHNAIRKKKEWKKKENWACAFFCLLAGFLSFGVMGHCWCIMHLMHIMHIILGNGINSVNVVNVVNAIIFDTSRFMFIHKRFMFLTVHKGLGLLFLMVHLVQTFSRLNFCKVHWVWTSSNSFKLLKVMLWQRSRLIDNQILEIADS